MALLTVGMGAEAGTGPGVLCWGINWKMRLGGKSDRVLCLDLTLCVHGKLPGAHSGWFQGGWRHHSGSGWRWGVPPALREET